MATIFVLEDDPDLLNLYTRALSFRGYTILNASSAESAIQLLAEATCKPDIAVLDMSMPGLPGSAVVEYIRRESSFQRIPIIVVSCDDGFRTKLEGSNVHFMTKPINLADLYQVVARLTVPVTA